MAPAVEYPFVPKSNRHLRRGQFWAIPLSNGRFAAGRVTAVPAFGPADRTGVVVGLMDWSGDREPTADDLIGRTILGVQAHTRYEAISKTGGSVLGYLPLELDRIAPADPTEVGMGNVTSVWGWRTIVKYAEAAFGSRNE